MSKTNIILVGMPGSGKTTAGKMLAEKLNRSFVDTDERIVEKEQLPISKIFEEKGEAAFRKVEKEICREVAALQNAVISTGGGVVMSTENMEVLASSGVIVFIDRPVEKIIGDIEDSTRPLLKGGKERLYTLHSERIDAYRKYADAIITNVATMKELIETIVDSVKIQGGSS